MNFRHRSMVALCPSCESPFHFTQTEFFVENDGGGWTVVCPECNKNFKFPVLNPQESSTKDQWRVTPFYDWPGGNIDTPIAAEIVTHDLPKTNLIGSTIYLPQLCFVVEEIRRTLMQQPILYCIPNVTILSASGAKLRTGC